MENNDFMDEKGKREHNSMVREYMGSATQINLDAKSDDEGYLTEKVTDKKHRSPVNRKSRGQV